MSHFHNCFLTPPTMLVRSHLQKTKVQFSLHGTFLTRHLLPYYPPPSCTGLHNPITLVCTSSYLAGYDSNVAQGVA
jgi:hypothetical protein